MSTPARPRPSASIATLVLAVVTTALFAYSVLEAMLSPALPEIQRAVGASTTEIAWVFTGLLLAGAVATPLVGRLADVRDKRTVLLGVLVIVGVGTLLAALARDVAVLTAGQVLQGVGISLVPLAVAVIRDTQPTEHIASRNGLIIATATLGTALGLVIAGPLLEVLPYTWLYWMPLAVVVASIVVAWVVVPSCPPAARGHVDWAGAGLLGTGLALLLIGISQISSLGWTSPIVPTLVAAGAAVLALFAWWELRTADPLVDLRLLGERTVVLTCAVSFAVGFGTFAGFVLVPMLVGAPTETGYGLGGSALVAGFYLVPLGIVGTVVAPLTGRLEQLVGARGVMLVGTGAMVAAAFALLLAPYGSWWIVVSTSLSGLTVGFGLTQAMNNVVAAVPEERTASVSGLAFVLKSIGGTLGAQLGAVLLARSADPADGQASWSGFQHAFLVAAGVSIVAVILSAGLPARPRRRPAGPPAEQVSGA